MNTPRTRIARRRARTHTAGTLTEQQIENIAATIYQTARTVGYRTAAPIHGLGSVPPGSASICEHFEECNSDSGRPLLRLNAFDGFAEKVAAMYSRPSTLHMTEAH